MNSVPNDKGQEVGQWGHVDCVNHVDIRTSADSIKYSERQKINAHFWFEDCGVTSRRCELSWVIPLLAKIFQILYFQNYTILLYPIKCNISVLSLLPGMPPKG